MPKSIVGVPANHSTTTPTPGMKSRQEAPEDAASDPNLSGMHPTQDAHPWEAGPLSGFQDNDDYMEFSFHTGTVAESRLNCCPVNDGDYDDNGGHPTAMHTEHDMPHAVHGDHEFGTDETSPISDWPEPDERSQGSIQIERIKRR